MPVRIYNTLTRKKETVETLEPNRVLMYVCGPTVYASAHVGHAMSSLVFDIIRRYLEYRGYQVIHAMNFTDVDDKIILAASYEGIDPSILAERYIQEFRQQLTGLNILEATINPRATQDMAKIIEMVENLVENGFAYQAQGDVYFRVSRLDSYGKLSGRRLEDMQAGTRFEVDARKENPLDFALWKAAKEGEPSWVSPWGEGRPGWHIECSAMSYNHLGEQIDIHGGGNDLIFPHHENEIAQTESVTGKPFARYWVHNGMLQLSGEKMSKSLGNLVSVEQFLAQHEGDVLRMMVLNGGYRSPLSFNDEIVEQSERALERLRLALRPAQENNQVGSTMTWESLQSQMEKTSTGFTECMDDDFNTAGALGTLFDLVRAINQARNHGISGKDLELAQELLVELSSVLGLQLRKEKKGNAQVEGYVELLIELRSKLREEKLWELSDMVRDRLADLGVLLEDGKGETTWRWK